MPEIRRCAAEAGAPGRVEIALSIDAEGRVTAATRTNGDAALGACAERWLGTAVFTPRAHGVTTYVLTQRRPLKTTEEGVTVTPGLPPEVVRRILRVAFPGLRACRAVADGDESAETIGVTLQIDDAGRVQGVEVRGGTSASETRRACFVEALRALSFPPPDRRVDVTARVTFEGG